MLHTHTRRRSSLQLSDKELLTALPETTLLSTDLQQLTLADETTKVLTADTGSLNDKFKIPAQGLSEELTYELIHNELTLDGNPHLNLASFVNTFTTPVANRLIRENINKNLADNDEYPQLIELTQRCISILAQLWKCDPNDKPIGCSTTGSSEAIMLGGLAMKKKWEHKMSDAGKDTSKPNIVMSCACQVALEKFTRYFEVECRTIPVSTKSHHMLDPEDLRKYVDENTIGCFVILGTTYTGHFENVERCSEVLDEIEALHPDWSNKNIPIHVDGASGGFIVPFSFDNAHMRKFKMGKWAFNNPRVVSINTSGHKFGLTTPGLGWVLWKQDSYLSPELRFRLKYLGGVEETFGLNFSRPGFQVVHQYFNFISLGSVGYSERFRRSLYVARTFSYGLLNLPSLEHCFEVVSSIHERIDDDSVPTDVKDYWVNQGLYKPGVPLVAFRLTDKFRNKYSEIPQVLISSLLRQRGWIIPNYPLPKSTDDSDKKEILRVVFRTEMKLDLAELLLADIQNVVNRLVSSYKKLTERVESGKYESVENRRNYVYNMLLELASPADDSKQPTIDTKRAKEGEQRAKENYRGTC
ncbi:glutamate decarboxylase gad1 [Maudiozyma exigua]|uniref:Glutamate decarboxylase n=1 Tax=Maudiozyma exigua TaxID=34358 RepID=A0A9P6W9T5_MAUEX|nr:glutamate decarboxylase gad1 [Kazachstania exigua]